MKNEILTGFVADGLGVQLAELELYVDSKLLELLVCGSFFPFTLGGTVF